MNNQEHVLLLCQQDQTSAVMQIMIPVHNDRPPPTPSCASCACACASASCACEVTSGQMEPTDNCWLQACDSGKQRGDNPLSGICANGDLGIIMVDGSEPRGLSTSGHIHIIYDILLEDIANPKSQHICGRTKRDWLKCHDCFILDHIMNHRSQTGWW